MRVKKRELGVYLCYLLRHNPEELGLNLNKAGFTDKSLSELYVLLKQMEKFTWLSKDLLYDVIRNDSRGRFEISGNAVRALYGHSIPVQIELDTPLENLPKVMYHGTKRKNKDNIMSEGLSAGERQFVHLSGSIEIAKLVATRRKGESIVLKIETLKAYKAGCRFKVVGRGTILSTKITPDLLEIVE